MDTISRPGLMFREVMRGPFASAQTEPSAGAREGLRGESTLVLRVAASIDDIGRFVRDPEHTGSLNGSVTFPGIGAQDSPAQGMFKLFVATPDPQLKLMVYQVTFRVGGAHYTFDGAKHVRRRSVLRAWSDTTTLYGRLHAGPDAQAPVIAAGVLHLRALDFARQLLSFRTGATGTGIDGVRALVAFFGFFSREVVDTYLWRGTSR